MHDLSPITALGGSEPRIDTVSGVRCAEVPDVALASIAARQGREAEVKTALARLIGAPAPNVGACAGTTVAAFWTGPDQWLAEAPFATHEDLASQVKSAMGDAASVTEQSDAWTRFDLSGDDVLAVFELLCPLATGKMTAGSAARSSIHHLSCFVLCRSHQSYSVYGPRASEGSLHHAIVTAMTSAL